MPEETAPLAAAGSLEKASVTDRARGWLCFFRSVSGRPYGSISRPLWPVFRSVCLVRANSLDSDNGNHNNNDFHSSTDHLY